MNPGISDCQPKKDRHKKDFLFSENNLLFRSLTMRAWGKDFHKHGKMRSYESYDYDYDYAKMKEKKSLLFVLDGLTLIGSLAIFGICIWIRFDLDFREWVYEIDWFTYWYCMYVVMIAMVFAMLTSCFHIYAMAQNSLGSLTLTQIVFAWCMFMEFIGTLVICLYGVEESPLLTDQLNDVFMRLIFRVDYDHRAMRILRIIQEYVGCCGANGSEDYWGAFKPVPWECRDPVMGKEYSSGCAQQMAWWLEPWSATLAGMSLFLLVVHGIQIGVTSSLKQYMHRYMHDIDHIDYDYDTK
eukprot:maker-scaffold379_size191255-snap-gene-0.27 protein:Tk09401 transcript:maker-scaffold379_size191255-snap-gene-0.27-mRNA-1 annotation:"hypothetical protein DAPPUDRAFT_300599"